MLHSMKSTECCRAHLVLNHLLRKVAAATEGRTHCPLRDAAECYECQLSLRDQTLHTAPWSYDFSLSEVCLSMQSFDELPLFTTEVYGKLTFLFLKACLARYPLQAAWNKVIFLLVWTSRCSSSLDRVPALKNTCRRGGIDASQVSHVFVCKDSINMNLANKIGQ